MAKSLNKVQLIGNLTRDPELRYTPQGTAVCSFGIATNRRWKTDSGDQRDEADFHRIVSWDKLAEICAQLLKKGARTYVEGRLQTRNWETKDGDKRTTTEVVITDMIALTPRRDGATVEIDVPEDFENQISGPQKKSTGKAKPKAAKKTTKSKKDAKSTKKEQVEDIPF